MHLPLTPNRQWPARGSDCHSAQIAAPVPADIPLEFHERRDPATLVAFDPSVEMLFGEVWILEREHGLEAFFQSGPVFRLDHRQAVALPFGQVLLVFPEDVFRILERPHRLFRVLDLVAEALGLFRLAPLGLFRLPLQVEQGDAGPSPRIQPDRVQGVVDPFLDMERIDAAVCVRAVFLRRVGDPPRAVPSDDEDCLALFRGQLVEEEVQHLLAVPFVRPDDGVRIVVDDGRDVAVALAVAGLVDADPDESVVALPHVRFEFVPDKVDEPSDRIHNVFRTNRA